MHQCIPKECYGTAELETKVPSQSSRFGSFQIQRLQVAQDLLKSDVTTFCRFENSPTQFHMFSVSFPSWDIKERINRTINFKITQTKPILHPKFKLTITFSELLGELSAPQMEVFLGYPYNLRIIHLHQETTLATEEHYAWNVHPCIPEICDRARIGRYSDFTQLKICLIYYYFRLPTQFSMHT